MSYGLLTDGSKVVELCDDLEAFFYVILYLAVRYLDSNCEDVATYIEDFFDCYTLYNDVYYAGEKKKSAIKYADLDLSGERANRTLSFTTQPLHDMVVELLKSFSAHYKVVQYDATRNAVIPALPLPPSKVFIADDDDSFIPDADLAPQTRATAKKADDSAVPTEEERARAKNVTDHDLFLGILRTAMLSKGWSKDWQDRVSDTSVSSRKESPPANGKQSKKRRTER